MKQLYRKIFQRFGLDRYLSYWVILAIDTIASVGCTLLSFVMSSYFLGILLTPQTYLYITALSLLFSIAAFYFTRTFKVIIRHSTVKETWKIGAAAVLKCGLLLMCCTRVLHGNILLGGILMDVLFTFVMLIVIRVVMILIYDSLKAKIVDEKRYKDILIFGTDEKSVAMTTTFQANDSYRIRGFLNRGKALKSYRMADKPVFYFETKEDFGYVVDRYGVDAILFPDYDTVQDEKEGLIRLCEARKVKILIVPPVNEASDSYSIRQSIREIKIEDLLGREEISINLKDINKNFSGKTILVTGAAGSIGSELCRQLTNFDIRKLILFDSAETPMHNFRLELEERYPDLDFIPIIGDVRIKARLDMVFRKYRPDIIFHAAAYKHVPLMETNPCEAIFVNVGGSRNVADLALEYGSEKMVMISTDKAVNPTNIMGASKRLAEVYIQSLGIAIEHGLIKGNTRFVTTRFGNVLGSNGSVIPLFRRQIEQGGPVTVTHPDIIRFFMTIPEATRLVMEAASMSRGNEIFVFDMGEPMKIVDLAKRMIELAGFTPDKEIKIEFSGLRPGEKLYEEVLSNDENTLPTSHHKIRIAKVREYEYYSIKQEVIKLLKTALRGHVEETVIMTKQLIPEYKSKNSRFEKYDTPSAEVTETRGGEVRTA